MNAKTTDPETASRDRWSTDEELAPCDPAADEAFIDAFIERNKDALNASIKLSEEQFARGEYFTHDDVFAELRAQSQRRRTAK